MDVQNASYKVPTFPPIELHPEMQSDPDEIRPKKTKQEKWFAPGAKSDSGKLIIFNIELNLLSVHRTRKTTTGNEMSVPTYKIFPKL